VGENDVHPIEELILSERLQSAFILLFGAVHLKGFIVNFVNR